MVSRCLVSERFVLTLVQTGPISSLNVLGKTIIILNDAQLAAQLLEKRSAIYSSRPQQNFTEM